MPSQIKLGQFQITILHDGYMEFSPLSVFSSNADYPLLQSFLRSQNLPTNRIVLSNNIPLVRTQTQWILIDGGSGLKFMKTTGSLLQNLYSAGVQPDRINAVVITHAHPDHLWGLITARQETFPNATYFLHHLEWRFWTDPSLIHNSPDYKHFFIRGTQKILQALKHKIQPVQGNTQVLPGITLLDTPGHTPGHSAVMIESQGEMALCVGDTLVHPWTSFEHPEWAFGHDLIPHQACSTRRRLLDMAATDYLNVLGFHLPFPGIGNIVRHKSFYQWLSLDQRQTSH